MFSRNMLAGWGDMDFNSHMRNTAYLDKAADLRMMFFAENDFPVKEFISRRIGPVIRKDELEYFSEISLLEEFRVTLAVAGLADNGSHFLLSNEFFRDSGQLAARVKSHGGWLDQAKRKLIIPPAAMLEVMHKLPKTEDFQVLPSSVK